MALWIVKSQRYHFIYNTKRSKKYGKNTVVLSFLTGKKKNEKNRSKNKDKHGKGIFCHLVFYWIFAVVVVPLQYINGLIRTSVYHSKCFIFHSKRRKNTYNFDMLLNGLDGNWCKSMRSTKKKESEKPFDRIDFDRIHRCSQIGFNWIWP